MAWEGTDALNKPSTVRHARLTLMLCEAPSVGPLLWQLEPLYGFFVQAPQLLLSAS